MGAYSLIRGRAMRVTRLNGCGNPVLGPDSVVSTDGFISVALTSNTEAGEPIVVTNANGKRCVDDTPVPRFVNYSLEMTFCGVDPELMHLLTGQPVVLSADGSEVVGFRQNSKIDVEGIGFALEMWTGVAGAACDSNATVSYGYLLLPFIKGGVVGNITVENGAINFTVTGATTKDGSGWGVGPNKVVRDEVGNPGPLNEAITDGDHLHTEVTTVPPPSALEGGATALGVPATGYTAGTPGTTTPANSYAAANLTELQASSAAKTPSTAWTTGQRVVLRDGSTAHWTGTAWAAGPA